MVAPPVSAPLFVLTNARSGSTLVRFLLDAHPEIACPPESRIVRTCGDLLSAADDLGTTASAVPAARQAILATVMPHLEARGKRVWAEKSLWTLGELAPVRTVFPDARFLCLYRQPFDFVLSALDSCRYGFARYGFAGYVRRRPENLVAALCDYWADRTRDALELERQAPEHAIRVRYEDLVTAPADTVQTIFNFIGVDASDSAVAQCLHTALATRHLDGAADSEIRFRHTIDRRSVGRGRSVPVTQLTDDERARVNELSAELGYPRIDDRWNLGDAEGPGALDGRQRSVAEHWRRRLAQGVVPPAEPLEIRLGATTGGRCRWRVDPIRREVSPLGESDAALAVVYQTHLSAAEALLDGSAEISLAISYGVVQELSAGGANVHRDADRVLGALMRASPASTGSDGPYEQRA